MKTSMYIGDSDNILFANNFLKFVILSKPSQFSESRKDTCRCLTT